MKKKSSHFSSHVLDAWIYDFFEIPVVSIPEQLSELNIEKLELPFKEAYKKLKIYDVEIKDKKHFKFLNILYSFILEVFENKRVFIKESNNNFRKKTSEKKSNPFKDKEEWFDNIFGKGTKFNPFTENSSNSKFNDKKNPFDDFFGKDKNTFNQKPDNSEYFSDEVYLIFEIEKRPKNKISFEEIRKKYKQFALIYHPDRNGGDEEKTEKFKKIKNIYDILEGYYN
uniref:J domain-containing protein n=1 Tax=viral metagenome TaxID=1070528 RepID=A0A6C0AE80_9ZZZZ